MEQETLWPVEAKNGSEPQPSQPGVFVYTQEVQGGRAVAVDVVGGLDPLAAPALLELAVKAARNKIGL